MKSLLEAAKSDDDEKIGENDEAKKEFEDIVVDVSSTKVKSSFFEKATKIWKNLPVVLTPLSKNSCFVKTSGRFFQIS